MLRYLSLITTWLALVAAPALACQLENLPLGKNPQAAFPAFGISLEDDVEHILHQKEGTFEKRAYHFCPEFSRNIFMKLTFKENKLEQVVFTNKKAVGEILTVIEEKLGTVPNKPNPDYHLKDYFNTSWDVGANHFFYSSATLKKGYFERFIVEHKNK